jgi:hypothetical protein
MKKNKNENIYINCNLLLIDINEKFILVNFKII